MLLRNETTRCCALVVGLALSGATIATGVFAAEEAPAPVDAAVTAPSSPADAAVPAPEAAVPAPEASSEAAKAELPPACFVQPAKLDGGVVKSFLDAPGALLDRNPTGGLPMTAEVRSLAGSDTATVGALIELAKQSNVPQKVAIGSGLARAAESCVKSDPTFAAYVQQEVAKSGDSSLTIAFLSTTGDTQTAALSGPGGASNAGGSSLSGNGPGPEGGGGGDGDDTVTTRSGDYTVSGAAALTSRRDNTSPSSSSRN